jgi:hypothetical protein
VTVWTFGARGAAAKSGSGAAIAANARRNNVAARGRAEWGRGVRLKRGLAGGTRNAVMLRDEACFSRSACKYMRNTFEEWKKWEDEGKNVRAGRKDVQRY